MVVDGGDPMRRTMLRTTGKAVPTYGCSKPEIGVEPHNGDGRPPAALVAGLAAAASPRTPAAVGAAPGTPGSALTYPTPSSAVSVTPFKPSQMRDKAWNYTHIGVQVPAKYVAEDDVQPTVIVDTGPLYRTEDAALNALIRTTQQTTLTEYDMTVVRVNLLLTHAIKDGADVSLSQYDYTLQEKRTHETMFKFPEDLLFTLITLPNVKEKIIITGYCPPGSADGGVTTNLGKLFPIMHSGICTSTSVCLTSTCWPQGASCTFAATPMASLM